jgi:hypothetical protein
VNEPALQLFRGLLPAAVLDMRAILRRRGLLLIILTVAFTVVAALVAGANNERGLTFILTSLASIAAFAIFADAMRIARPDYRLDAGRVIRLMWYGLLVFVLIAVCYLPFGIAISVFAPHGASHIEPQPWKSVEDGIVYLITIVVGARLAFLCFLCEQEGARAFSFSWRLTARPALGATLLLYTLAVVPSAIVTSVSDALEPHVAPALFTSSLVFVNLIVIFGVAAFLYPLLMRWMMVCERVHPDAYVGFNEPLANPV